MKKTNQVRINNEELFLITSALKHFMDDRKLYEFYGFSKEEVELLHTKLIREDVVRRNNA